MPPLKGSSWMNWRWTSCFSRSRLAISQRPSPAIFQGGAEASGAALGFADHQLAATGAVPSSLGLRGIAPAIFVRFLPVSFQLLPPGGSGGHARRVPGLEKVPRPGPDLCSPDPAGLFPLCNFHRGFPLSGADFSFALHLFRLAGTKAGYDIGNRSRIRDKLGAK